MDCMNKSLVVKCSQCGREFNRYQCDEIFTGRSHRYICPTCKKFNDERVDTLVRRSVYRAKQKRRTIK